MTGAPVFLPGPLPKGERVLWKGRPRWQAIARDALHVRGLAAYMALLVLSVAAAAAWRGATPAEALLDASRAAAFAAIPVAVALGYAWLAARAAYYAITDRRIIMRVGVALPMTFNLPFARIASAGQRTRGSTGEIGVKLLARDGLAAIMLWPHAPLGRAEPTLRGLADVAVAGQVLAHALAASVDPAATPASVQVPVASAARKVETDAAHDPHAVAA